MEGKATEFIGGATAQSWEGGQAPCHQRSIPEEMEQPRARGVVSPNPHLCPPGSWAGSWGPGWGTPLQREPQRHQGRWTPPPAKSAPAGLSGALSHHCCPQPRWQPRWDSDTPAGGISGDSGAGRRWKRCQGRLQLAEDQALVVGRHVHLEHSAGARGCTRARRAPQGPSPTILSRHSPLASASSRSSAVSRSPQAGFLRGGRRGSHTGTSRPEASPAPRGAPGCRAALRRGLS